MSLIRKDIVLFRQKRTSGINNINTRQSILLGNLLRSNMFLNSDGVVSTAFVSEVIANKHAFLSINHAHTCNNVAGGDTFV